MAVYHTSPLRAYFDRYIAPSIGQLWQRDRAKLDTFSINVQRYPQNHKIAFLGHPMGASGAIQALYESFNAKKLCSRVSSRE